jgi:hypothetical protein
MWHPAYAVFVGKTSGFRTIVQGDTHDAVSNGFPHQGIQGPGFLNYMLSTAVANLFERQRQPGSADFSG